MVCRAARRGRGPQALQRELPQVGSARPSFQSLVELIRWPGAVGGQALLNPVPRSAGGGMGAHLRQAEDPVKGPRRARLARVSCRRMATSRSDSVCH